MRKILIASLILIFPVVGYLLLQTGKNHYVRLPYFGKKAARGDLHKSHGKLFRDTLFHNVFPFSLTSTSGSNFSSAKLNGHLFITNFFYSTCPDVCKSVHTGMASLVKTFRIHPEINFLSVTVNPQYDTPARLKKYADSLGADSTRWHFLTGDPDSIAALANRHFLVDAGTDHSQLLTLCDGAGHIRGYYDGTQPAELKRLLDELIVLRLEQIRAQVGKTAAY